MKRGNESGTFLSAKVASPEDALKCGERLECHVASVNLEQVLAELNAICKTATLKFALDVGSLVVTHFYGGKLEMWRNRDHAKDASLRKLARHPHLPMSPSALYRSIAIYELCERLHVRSWKHVSTGHIRLVLPLDPDRQARFLSTAEAQRWTVRQLDAHVEAEVRSHPSARTDRGGVARHGTFRKVMRRLERFAAALQMDSNAILESDLSTESTREAIHLLQGVADACTLIQSRLCGQTPGITDVISSKEGDLERQTG